MTDTPDWMFRQSGVVPWRRGAAGLEVLMVTSRRQKRWVLPKGVVERHLSPAESAATEAFEEAGVRGPLGAPLGSYRYAKWGGTCTVEMFAMEVAEELAEWPEGGTRRRAWLTVGEARRRIDEKGLRDILDGFARRVAEA